MKQKRPTFSILISARKDSKYLAKFLFGLLANTDNLSNCEILVMLNKHDTWNKELVDNFNGLFRFYKEDYKLGRAGLHIYFNDLYKKSTGHWIIYFCEDHFVSYPGWDTYLLKEFAARQIDPRIPYCIVPKFDNAGAMNHVLSRPYIDAMGQISQHGNLDSYINEVNSYAFPLRGSQYVVKLDKELFHDFTHDIPSPMADSATQSALTTQAAQMPKYTSEEVRRLVIEDAEKIKKIIGG